MTTRIKIGVPVLLVASLCATGLAHAWISLPNPRMGYGISIAVFPNGDFVGALRYDDPLPETSDLALARVSADTGGVIWRLESNAIGPDTPLQVAVDSVGNVVVSGISRQEPTPVEFVMKLDGLSGAVVWRTDLIGAQQSLGGQDVGIAIDAHDDVIVGGTVFNVATTSDPVVLKLKGGDGGVLWRTERNAVGFEYAVKVAVNASGDVFVVSEDDQGIEHPRSVIRRLSGLDGSVIWTTTAAPPSATEQAISAVLDGAGRFVVAAGSVSDADFDVSWIVTAVSESDGAVIWRTGFDGKPSGPASYDWPSSIAASPDGQIYVAGSLGDRSAERNFIVAALDGASGTERWRYQAKGHGIALGMARRVAVAPDGSPVATGYVGNKRPTQDMFVTRLRASDGRPVWETSPELTTNPPVGEGADLCFDAANGVGIVGHLFDPQIQYNSPSIVKLRLENGAR